MKVLLAQKLREFRKKQGLTQEQLAEAMGVTVGAVSKWVNIPPQTGQQNGGNRSRVTVEMSPGVRLQVQAVE